MLAHGVHRVSRVVAQRLDMLGKILADAEVLTGCAHDDRAYRWITARCQQSLQQFGFHRPVKRVRRLRPIEHDRSDASVVH
ncbi:Uncharacterised protein [Mycobacteroides abscessus subsp. abscessus]|nr:Uncharacterised protein [Mycobacteroides abscessus subsp. abscessus]